MTTHDNAPAGTGASQEDSGEHSSQDNTPLVAGRSPFDHACAHLSNGGVFTAELYEELRLAGGHPLDIGRFARKRCVKRSEFITALSGVEHGEKRLVIHGLTTKSPPSLGDRVPDFRDHLRLDIETSEPDARILASKSWEAVEAANDPAQVFRFGSSSGWVVGRTGGAPTIASLIPGRLSWLMRRVARYGFWKTLDSGDTEFIEAKAPEHVIADMLAEPHPPLPELLGTTSVPIFSPDGDLRVESGYDPASQMFVWTQGLSLPFVPLHPTASDVARAVQVIGEELLGEFPFVDEASKANAIAALLLPPVRPMILGPTPLHLIDKPVPDTGGTLLAQVISVPTLGRTPTMITETNNENEWRWKLVAELKNGRPILIIDNVEQKLGSAVLASMLTVDSYSDRGVGSSDSITLPIKQLWIANGNNVQLSDQMPRRVALIRLDAHGNPADRVFRHRPLIGWTLEHRGRLVWAMLVLVQAWKAEGYPPGSQVWDTYESYARVMGGILDVAGIPGFLGNRDQPRQFSDPDTDAWISIVHQWWVTFGDKTVGARDTLPIAEDHLGDLGDSLRSRQTSWGQRLRAKRDNVIGDKKIAYVGTTQGAAQYRLVEVKSL
jgi:putative DNA primase/helicase